MNEDLESLVEPQPEDTMDNHAEQHSAMTRLQKEISERVKNGEVLQTSIADRLSALEGTATGTGEYMHGNFAEAGYASVILSGSNAMDNFTINEHDSLGNTFIRPSAGETFTFALNGEAHSFEVDGVYPQGEKIVVQGRIGVESEDGDIISVDVEETAGPGHDHEEMMTKSGSQFIEAPWKVKEEANTYIVIEDGEQGLYHLATPTAWHHAVNKKYVDGHEHEEFLETDGGAMNGTIEFPSISKDSFKFTTNANGEPKYLTFTTGSYWEHVWKGTSHQKMIWDLNGKKAVTISQDGIEIDGELKINGQQVDPASIVFDMSEQQRKIEELTQVVNELKARLDRRENG